MNISPHHQRPTNYPWPGIASRMAVVLAVAAILLIGFILVADPFANDDQAQPAAMPAPVTQGL